MPGLRAKFPSEFTLPWGMVHFPSWFTFTAAAELNADTTRLALGGASAGGNLTAVVTQIVLDQERPQLTFQLLIYPATDLITQAPSKTENATGYFLTRDDMNWFEGHYLQSHEEKHNPMKRLSSSPFITAQSFGSGGGRAVEERLCIQTQGW